MKEKACPKCGLIQLDDIIWGLAICNSAEAYMFGCPDKETVLEHVPGSKYDESIKAQQQLTPPPLFMKPPDYGNNQT